MKRRIVTAVLALGAIFLIFWAFAWFTVGGQVPRNTRVLGLEIGAHSRSEAVRLLDQRLSVEVGKPIVLETIGKLHKVNPRDIGATFDISATIAEAGARPISPFRLFARVFSPVDVEPVVKIDSARFTHTVDDLAKRSEVSLREGSVVFKGTTPVAIWPVDGRSIDKSKALGEFKSQWLRTSPIQLSTTHQHAQVTSDEVKRVIKEIAYPSVNEPITLIIDGHDLLITPADIASSITFVPGTNRNLIPRFSSDALGHSLGNTWFKLVPPAKDAIFKFINDKPRVYPAVIGRMITDDSLTEALTPVLDAVGPDRRATIATTSEQPRITTEEAGGLGISDQISTYTTKFPPAAYRIQNIHRAADLIDGTILKPGEIFSLNKVVGERTAANGFAEGIIIFNGHFAKDFGGGVSQVATTTWNAAWFGGVDLVAHMAHSFYISRYPAGRESTVAWPNIDIQFRNDTGHLLLVHTSYTNSSLTVSLYGTRKYTVETITGPRKNITDFAISSDDTPTCISQGGVVGFDIDVTRILKNAGVEVSREVFHTHYVPEDRITCTNPAAVFGNPPIKAPAKPRVTAKPTPKPTTTTPVTTSPTPATTP